MAIDYKFVKLFNNSELLLEFNLDELNNYFDDGYLFEGEIIDTSSSSVLLGKKWSYVKLVKYECDYCDCKFTFTFGSPNPNSMWYKNIIPTKLEFKYVDVKLFKTSFCSDFIVVNKYSNDSNNYKIDTYKMM